MDADADDDDSLLTMLDAAGGGSSDGGEEIVVVRVGRRRLWNDDLRPAASSADHDVGPELYAALGSRIALARPP